MAAENERGSITFFTTYRPPVPLDIFSCPVDRPSEEIHLTDGRSYNCNGQMIPPAALKKILKRPKLEAVGTDADVDSGRLTGMVFVSERDNLETLYIALRFTDNKSRVEVFSFPDVFGTFNGVRMEDSACTAGESDYIFYVSTKDPATDRREPWTAVYKTNLFTGKTDRLTPSAQADLSPAVSPCGKKILVASFQRKGGWDGAIDDLKTDILLMNVEKPFKRRVVVNNGGWPTWGSDNIIFFHRKVDGFWAVFRADISSGGEVRVTPEKIHAITPAAINATTVAVATIRQDSKFTDVLVEAQYRHIEIFDITKRQSIQITRNTRRSKTDHFNPFVIDGGTHIGYHRCRSETPQVEDDVNRQFQELKSPNPNTGLFRVSGVFPTFSKDGKRLAFVDNDFKSVRVADSAGLRLAYQEKGPDNIFFPVWNQDADKDTLYVCRGPSFSTDEVVNIYAIPHVSRKRLSKQLTKGYNNAFPSTSPDGKRFVFRSRREDGYKNLYIMEDAEAGEIEGSKVTRLTQGDWTDTHCQWSPSGDWIVFSSTRDKPTYAPKTDNGLDPGYFAVFLVNANNPDVVVRVFGSGSDLVGHVNHPIFSPDGKSIVVTSDLAAVSADPISLPRFLHSVRPYGDIFTVDIDLDDINKNKNVKKFNRITHSRYENSPGGWTKFSTQDSKAGLGLLLNSAQSTLPCPYASGDGGETWQMTSHHFVPKRLPFLDSVEGKRLPFVFISTGLLFILYGFLF